MTRVSCVTRVRCVDARRGRTSVLGMKRLLPVAGCAVLWLGTATAAESTPPRPSTEARFTCAGKRTCAEMASCEEAQFYLTQCSVVRLDGDKDGVPCESLCRR